MLRGVEHLPKIPKEFKGNQREIKGNQRKCKGNFWKMPKPTEKHRKNNIFDQIFF